MIRFPRVMMVQKEEQLFSFISRYRSALIAFSGGVDSAYLAFAAHQVLGERACAVTALSPSVSSLQKDIAIDFAHRYGLNHHLVKTGEMDNPDYTTNPSNRCYFCKTELYDQLEVLRERWDVEVIFDGSNADDVSDYRPGHKAAREREVISPLVETNITKEEIRKLSRKRGLPTWDQPAMPCLSSRFPYGVKITEKKLGQVEQAEAFLRNLGLCNFRVRHHENLARIEVDQSEMSRLMDPKLFEQISSRFKSIGYSYVTLDLEGFRSGSLNEELKKD